MRTFPVLFVFTCSLWTACQSENKVYLQRRELRTNQNTYDAGITAVGDRQTFPVILQSVGLGPVTIYDIQSSDPDRFVVLDSWKAEDLDGDNVVDGLTLEGGTEEDPAQTIVEINFRPNSEENFRAQLTIISNDSTTIERTDNDEGVWRAALRGVGEVPCLRVLPRFYDYGPKPPGGYFASDFRLQNCGQAPLTLSSFDFDGSASFYAASATPIYILANSEEVAQVAWIPASENPESVSVSLVVNDPNFEQQLELTGNNCSESSPDYWDVDEDGWTPCGGDCDDTNAFVNPEANELLGNGIDDNCNGIIDGTEGDISDPDIDDDNDGFTENEGDCHDDHPDIFPDAEDIPNNIDDNCDGTIDEATVFSDDDNDGWTERAGDCDDTDGDIFPDAIETENGIDDNCDGFVDEGSIEFDDDGDGVSDAEGDCNDSDPWTFPGAVEDCDNVDNNCNGEVDEGNEAEETDACGFVSERTTITPTEEKGCQMLSGLRPSHFILWPAILGFGFARRRILL
ncbi:MAG: putative metal-binding motif-containing protein [Myxococcota bacterium]|nr:putative metal-binding motif-containing protein [Myxococcota bacterium]